MTEFDRSLALLQASEMFFDCDSDSEIGDRCINLNDAFYWACADAEDVPDDCVVELGKLYDRYGMCGVYFWVLKRRGVDKVDFADVNRMVEFVRNEERIREAVADSSKRAYHKEAYTVGITP